MLTLVSLAPPAPGPGRVEMPDNQAAMAEAFLGLLAEVAPDTMPETAGTVAATTVEIAIETTDKTIDKTAGGKDSQGQEPSSDTPDAGTAMAIFMGLPMPSPPPRVKPDETLANAELQPAGPMPVTRQADSLVLPKAQEQMTALAAGVARPPAKAPEAAKPAPVHSPPITAPPDQLAEAPAPQTAALPESPRGAMESAARFRLDAAAEPEADDLPPLTSDVAGDMPLAGSPVSESRLEQRAADQALVSPHKQAAGHLTKMLAETGAQLATHANRSELTLAPEELGRIRFDIRQQGESLVVTLTADRPETLELMRRHANDLRSELAAAGYSGATLDFAGSGGRHPASGRPDTTAAFDTFAESAPAAPDPLPSPALQHPVAIDGLDLRF